MNICVAFDYMRVRVSDIKHMQKFNPALAALFEAEQTDSIDNGTTAQEKSNNINRAKGSKKPPQSVDTVQVENESPPITALEEKAAQRSKSAQKGLERDKKRSMKRAKSPQVDVP